MNHRMKQLMHLVVLSCRKATELIEKNIYFKLSLIEKIQLRMHMLLCDACTKYKKQSWLLHKILKHFEHDHQAGNLPADSSVEELKKKISNQLDEI
jgi:hypothetical protein